MYILWDPFQTHKEKTENSHNIWTQHDGTPSLHLPEQKYYIVHLVPILPVFLGLGYGIHPESHQ